MQYKIDAYNWCCHSNGAISKEGMLPLWKCRVDDPLWALVYALAHLDTPPPRNSVTCLKKLQTGSYFKIHNLATSLFHIWYHSSYTCICCGNVQPVVRYIVSCIYFIVSCDSVSCDSMSVSCDSIASFPGPTPFWRGIGPGKVSAVCVFTLGRTKKCATNQITILKHVKLTCDSCSLRRVSTECRVVHGAMAMRDFSHVCDEPAFRISNCQNLAVAGSSQTRQKSLIAMALWTTVHIPSIRVVTNSCRMWASRVLILWSDWRRTFLCVLM